MKKAVWGLVLATVMGIPLVVLGRGAGHAGRASLADAATARVGRRTLETFVKATGVIKPMVGAEVRVGSRASGVVARLHVRIGDTVAKGSSWRSSRLASWSRVAIRRRAALAVGASASATTPRADLRRKRDARAPPSSSRPATSTSPSGPARWPSSSSAEAAANLAFAAHAARLRAHRGAHLGRRRLDRDAGGRDRLGQPRGADLRHARRPGAARGLGLRGRDRHRPHPRRADRRASRSTPTRTSEFEGRVTAIYPQAEIRDNVVNYVTVVDLRGAAGPHAAARDDDDREDRAREPRGRAWPCRAPPSGARAGARSSTCRRGGEVVARPVTAGVRDDELLGDRRRAARGRRGPAGRVDAVPPAASRSEEEQTMIELGRNRQDVQAAGRRGRCVPSTTCRSASSAASSWRSSGRRAPASRRS